MLTWKEVEEHIDSYEDNYAKRKAIKGYLLTKAYEEYNSKLNTKLNNLITDKCAFIKREMIYDSLNEGLEPIYFWILDFMGDVGALGLSVEKEEKGYEASVTGAYYGEMGARMTQMQAKAMEYLGAINQVVKSILNILYDLKEFKMRLKYYDQIHSEDNEDKKIGLYSLKGVWMDNVDIKKGRGSVNSMAQDLQMVTLRDAFFYVDDVKQVKNLDLNQRIKNILTMKLNEFEQWAAVSEKELRTRYDIEKAYLKSQYGTFKLYSTWVMPYLKAAEKLRMKDTNSAHIVSAFSNMTMDLSLRGKTELKVTDINPYFKKYKIDRKYYAVLKIDLKFRTLPQVVQGQGGRHYIQGGRVDILYSGYGIDDLELKALEQAERNEILKVIEEYLGIGLQALETDIDEVINEPKKKDEDIEKIKKVRYENPFSIIWHGFKDGIIAPFKYTKDEFKKLTGLTRDDITNEYIDKTMLNAVENASKGLCTAIYDTYK